MRMNRIFALFLLLSGSLIAIAESNNLSIGIRGGAANYATDAEARSLFGPTLGIQASYSCLWSPSYTQLHLGIMTGIGMAWTQTGMSMEWQSQYVNTDYRGRRLQYTMQGTAVQKDRQFQFEVPLFFAFRWKGIRLNLGPQFMLVMPRTYSLSISEMSSELSFLDYGVTMTDGAISGQLPAERLSQTGKTLTPTFNLLLAVQAGYEFPLNDQHAIGLMAYFDYGIWSSYSNPNPTNRFVDVAPITDASMQAPEVAIYDLNASFVTRVNYMSFGLRFYWNMSWDFHRMRGGHLAPRSGRVYRQ